MSDSSEHEDNDWEIEIPPHRLTAYQEEALGTLLAEQERLINAVRPGDTPHERAAATMVVMRLAWMIDLEPARIIPPRFEPDLAWPLDELRDAARLVYLNAYVSPDEALVVAGLAYPRDYEASGPLVDAHPSYHRHVRRRVMLAIVAEIVLLPNHEWVLDRARDELERMLESGVIAAHVADWWRQIINAGPDHVAFILTAAPSKDLDELRKHNPFMRLGLVTQLERRAIIKAIRGDEGLREEGALPPRIELRFPPR